MFISPQNELHHPDTAAKVGANPQIDCGLVSDLWRATVFLGHVPHSSPGGRNSLERPPFLSSYRVQVTIAELPNRPENQLQQFMCFIAPARQDTGL